MGFSEELNCNLCDQNSCSQITYYLESYIHTYLREEILQEGLTRNLQTFARFLEAASFSQAALLNISAVARECGVKRKLAESYFHILYGEKGIHAMEVKRARTIRQRELSGLKAFLIDYPMPKGYLFYGGDRRLYQDGIELIPVSDGIRTLPMLLNNQDRQ